MRSHSRARAAVAAGEGAPLFGRARHKQRVLQLACGYDDRDDSDSLRTDPLLKLVCGRLPETGEDLASQPTISRLENAVGARACYRMAYALLGDSYIRQRQGELGCAPEKILLDFDSTDDPPRMASRKAAATTATTASTSTTFW